MLQVEVDTTRLFASYFCICLSCSPSQPSHITYQYPAVDRLKICYTFTQSVAYTNLSIRNDVGFEMILFFFVSLKELKNSLES